MRPVATVVQMGSACVGRNVARYAEAPPSSRRPKFGSRPAATASEMWSSDAPSTASTTTRPPGRSSPVTGRMAADGVAGGGAGDEPRSVSGTTTESAIVVTSSTPLGAVPRRPMCASATMRKTPPQMATAMAASVMRRAASTVRNGVKSATFSHSTVAPTPAEMVHIHASTRTLSQPGDSTCTAATWRSTTSA